MNAEFNIWLMVAALAIGAAVTWLVIGTLSRRDDEVAAAERAAEASWISDVIERWGGYAPANLVEQVLMLHRAYLRGGVPPEATRAEIEAGEAAADAAAGEGAAREERVDAAGEEGVDGPMPTREPPAQDARASGDASPSGSPDQMLTAARSGDDRPG